MAHAGIHDQKTHRSVRSRGGVTGPAGDQPGGISWDRLVAEPRGLCGLFRVAESGGIRAVQTGTGGFVHGRQSRGKI